jgi:hypothetical protein
MWLPLIFQRKSFFTSFLHSSFFTFHFKSYLFFFLLPEQKKKNQKRKLADCISSAKNGSRFPKARKLASCACSNSPRFFTENAPHSLNAPKMRSDLTDFLLIISRFVAYGFLQHRFARLSVF